MKKTFTGISMSILWFFLAGIVICGLVSLMSYQEWIPDVVAISIIRVLSALLFFFGGYIVGKKVKKRGLLTGLALAVSYLVIAAIFRTIGEAGWTSASGWMMAGRSFLLVLGTIVGVNRSH